MTDIARAYRRFNAGDSLLKRVLLKGSYYVFIVLPYPLRRVAVAGYISAILPLKRWLGVEAQDELTPLDEAGTLSFWGVPDVDLGTYTLTIDGAVDHPQLLRMDAVEQLPSVTRLTRMDCVGGFRNNLEMRGVRLAELLERAGLRPDAKRAIFYCADGYYESSTLVDLEAVDAMLVYELNGERQPVQGCPLRLAIPGKYGYKWAKWVQRIEIVTHDRKGYWPQRGLPDRANVEDRW